MEKFLFKFNSLEKVFNAEMLLKSIWWKFCIEVFTIFLALENLTYSVNPSNFDTWLVIYTSLYERTIKFKSKIYNIYRQSNIFTRITANPTNCCGFLRGTILYKTHNGSQELLYSDSYQKPYIRQFF